MNTREISSHDQLATLFNKQVCDEVGCSLNPEILRARAINLNNLLAGFSMHVAGILSMLNYQSEFTTKCDPWHLTHGRLKVDVTMAYQPPNGQSDTAVFNVTEKFPSRDQLPQYFTSQDPSNGILIDLKNCKTAQDITMNFLSFVIGKIRPEERALFMMSYAEYAIPELSNSRLQRLEH